MRWNLLRTRYNRRVKLAIRYTNHEMRTCRSTENIEVIARPTVAVILTGDDSHVWFS